MLKNYLLLTIFLFTGCNASQMTPSTAIEELGPNPYIEIDEEKVSQDEIQKYNADEISSITMLFNNDAIKLYGNEAKDGAVIIETKEFARNKYETFLKKNSNKYEELLNSINTEDIQYILNGRILKKDFEGNLAIINKKLLKKIKIIDQETLVKKYHIENKKAGVVIKAKRPKNLYNSKKKF